MNVGKTLVPGLGPFAHLMEFARWTCFARIVDRYSGNVGVRRMTCV